MSLCTHPQAMLSSYVGFIIVTGSILYYWLKATTLILYIYTVVTFRNTAESEFIATF